ncbi:MAG TPA: DUF192 domain-containing protein [Terracidiphilus sp.]|nr:DUF192 domain-containing protein [Terracidiphilus sp.]
MRSIRLIAENLRKVLAPSPLPVPDRRMRAVNTTRGSIVASSLEVADSGASRNKGLLGRDGLAPGGGLWIVPCQSVHTFFMRFPIDLVYIDSRKRVRKVKSAVGPGRISFCLTAQSIIELPAGTVLRTETQPGDMLAIEDVQPSEPAQ